MSNPVCQDSRSTWYTRTIILSHWKRLPSVNPSGKKVYIEIAANYQNEILQESQAATDSNGEKS